MSADEKRKLKGSTFKGWELVQSTARFCAMNLMLQFREIVGDLGASKGDTTSS
jgi:type I restriction enzyme M protein